MGIMMRTVRTDWGVEIMCVAFFIVFTGAMNTTEKSQLRAKVREMFDHAYDSYMTYAYPADELMPISCRGRYRGSEPSRGDIDDALGNFSLTLIDSLDTLAVFGDLDRFEAGVQKVIQDVSFDSDIVVSVFETNIRVLGGLLGAHVMARQLRKTRPPYMAWYADQLLNMASDIGRRLLPAFNTSTGIPYPRVNLRYGLTDGISRAGKEHDTCTACAGTIILEFAALSRMTGEPIFEEKAKRAMSYLWKQRHRFSNLVGTVINIHSGDWVRRDSGVGAGIDSYYEYLLKAYVLLGDETYLQRFDKHYDAVMKYINQGPMLLDVHMHRPTSNSRHFMDSLQAFWPGLQVLKGDIKPAIEIHEMLYQLVQRHNFLPEAFTTDFRIHWAHHPLRPEFLESTYFLYKATGDHHYLEVGKMVLENLEKHGRVQCGFAAIKDVTTGAHDDQMDSYVLAEFFKYLYLLFAEPADLIIDVDDYVFTTEAHLLPLTLSMHNYSKMADDDDFGGSHAEASVPPLRRTPERSCPSSLINFPDQLGFASTIREPLKNYVAKICPRKNGREPRLRARDFVAGNVDQLHHLRRMGIKIVTMSDGRVQLLHTSSEATTPDDAEEGLVFMQEMIDLSKAQSNNAVNPEVHYVQFLSLPYLGAPALKGGPAQFGLDLKQDQSTVRGGLVVALPFNGCTVFENAASMGGRIVVAQRGGCLFIDKARQIQAHGGIGAIIIDNSPDTSIENTNLFSMSGDGKSDVTIPVVFLFSKEGATLLEAMAAHDTLVVALTHHPIPQDVTVEDLLGRQRDLQRDIVDSEALESASVTSERYHAAPPNPPSDGSADLTTTIEFDGVQIKVKGQQQPGDFLATNPAVEMSTDSDHERRLRLDIDKLFAGRHRSEIQYDELTHKILQLLSESIANFDANEDYMNAVRTMIGAAVSTMNIGQNAEAEHDDDIVAKDVEKKASVLIDTSATGGDSANQSDTLPNTNSSAAATPAPSDGQIKNVADSPLLSSETREHSPPRDALNSEFQSSQHSLRDTTSRASTYSVSQSETAAEMTVDASEAAITNAAPPIVQSSNEPHTSQKNLRNDDEAENPDKKTTNNHL